MSETKSLKTIQSLQIGIDLLTLIGEQKKPLKFAEIQKLSGITKSNLYKYLNTLCQSGMLYRDTTISSYTLGHKLVELGSMTTHQTSFLDHAISYFKDINQHTNLTALLAIPSPNGPLVAHIFSADYGINIGAQIGTTLPLTSATGLLFSAFQQEDRLKQWVDSFTCTWTTTQLNTLKMEQQQAHEQFFVSKREPLVSHVSSFSIPILNFKEQLIGAITVVGYSELVPQSTEHPTSQYTMKIAKKLSEYYGFSKI